MLTLPPQHKAHAILRARLLNEFCNGHVLKFYGDLTFTEGANLCGEQSLLFPNYAYSDAGLWFPEVQLKRRSDNLRSTVVDEIRKAGQRAGLDRNSRRQIQKRLLSGNGLSREAVKLVEQEEDRIKASICEQFPLSDDFLKSRNIYKLLSAQSWEDLIQKEIRIGLSDPELFVSWYFDRHEKALFVRDWLRNAGENINSAMEETQAGVDRLTKRSDQNTVVGVMRKHPIDLRRFRKRLLAKSFTANKERLHRLGVNSLEWRRRVINSDFGSTPYTDAFVETTYWWYLNTACKLKGRQKPKRSDFADIMHAGYLPYVDVFRADKATAPLVAKAADRYGTTVVDRLEKLPECLEMLRAHPPH